MTTTNTTQALDEYLLPELAKHPPPPLPGDAGPLNSIKHGNDNSSIRSDLRVNPRWRKLMYDNYEGRKQT